MAREGQSTVDIQAAMLTDVGMVRDHNEDSAYIDPDHDFFIVADGMGGHAAGEIASAMAVDKVREALEGSRATIAEFATSLEDEDRREIVKLLESAVRSAHESVFDCGTRDSDKHGMGTTLDVVLLAGPEAFIAHVGDSRTYLIREGRAAQITTDHTVAEVLVIEGKLTLEEAQISPLRTILVNAIGVAPEVGIEMAHVQLRKDDRILICSDGLHDYFPVEQELAERIGKDTPEPALADLVELAKERGGHDNITGIVLQVDDIRSTESESSDGVVSEELEATLSDGVPGEVEAEGLTLPVDASEDTPEEANPKDLAENNLEVKIVPAGDVPPDIDPAMFEEPTMEHERPTLKGEESDSEETAD